MSPGISVSSKNDALNVTAVVLSILASTAMIIYLVHQTKLVRRKLKESNPG